MTIRLYTLVIPVFFAFFSCNHADSSVAISTDTAVIASGKMLFEKNCASCHHFNSDGIGPNLSGVTTKVSIDWLLHFIKNPQELITASDTRADSLFKKFKSVMPAFPNMKNEEMTALVAFIHSHKTTGVSKKNSERKGVLDPFPEKIKNSGLVVNLVPVTQFPASGNGDRPFTRITKLSYQPGTNAVFVNDLRGKLYKLKNGKPVIYLDMLKMRPHFVDAAGLGTGLGSFAFHPDFLHNGLLYTTHTESPGSGKADFTFNDSIKSAVQWVLTEWKVSSPLADAITGTSRELMRIDMTTDAHGVQEITFNPLAKKGQKDYGMLYVGVGDGMSVQEGYPFLAHERSKIWGTIIRVDPAGNNSKNGKYGIPSDNPYAKEKSDQIVPEIYAYGFRNPHRITWTNAGQMLASNIGQTNVESIYIVQPGKDYGWPIREGNFVLDPYGNLDDIFPLPANDSIHHITYPIAAFDHDEGNAITGGYEYTGHAIPSLKYKFLFGDIPSGKLFYIDLPDIATGKQAIIKEWNVTINGVAQTLKQACGSSRVDLHFGKDAAGEMYVMTKADGMLYKMVKGK